MSDVAKVVVFYVLLPGIAIAVVTGYFVWRGESTSTSARAQAAAERQAQLNTPEGYAQQMMSCSLSITNIQNQVSLGGSVKNMGRRHLLDAQVHLQYLYDDGEPTGEEEYFALGEFLPKSSRTFQIPLYELDESDWRPDPQRPGMKVADRPSARASVIRVEFAE